MEWLAFGLSYESIQWSPLDVAPSAGDLVRPLEKEKWKLSGVLTVHARVNRDLPIVVSRPAGAPRKAKGVSAVAQELPCSSNRHSK